MASRPRQMQKSWKWRFRCSRHGNHNLSMVGLGWDQVECSHSFVTTGCPSHQEDNNKLTSRVLTFQWPEARLRVGETPEAGRPAREGEGPDNWTARMERRGWKERILRV